MEMKGKAKGASFLHPDSFYWHTPYVSYGGKERRDRGMEKIAKRGSKEENEARIERFVSSVEIWNGRRQRECTRARVCK